MVKVAIQSIPPAYEPLLAKILAHFDNQIYPTWATRFFHKTRSAKKANKEKTYLPSIASYWATLTAEEKAAWGTAAAFGTLNKYQLFTTDFSYRRKNGLSLPGTPSDYHEVMGLRLDNPGGSENVRLRRDEKDLVGPIGISFTYKKTENSPTPSVPFKFLATAYYFDAGHNLTLTHEWEAPSGNVDWSQVSESFGVSGQKYFHLTILFYLDSYDATIYLDHFLIQSAGVDKYRECWQYKSGKTWEYDNLYRKTGWLFFPDYHVPYFEVLYLG